MHREGRCHETQLSLRSATNGNYWETQCFHLDGATTCRQALTPALQHEFICRRRPYSNAGLLCNVDARPISASTVDCRALLRACSTPTCRTRSARRRWRRSSSA